MYASIAFSICNSEFVGKIDVYVNEQIVSLPKFASVNGALQSEYYSICDGDEIEFLDYYTVKQIVEFMDVLLDENMNIYVNNRVADMDTKVYANFSVVWSMAKLYEEEEIQTYEELQNEEEYGETVVETAPVTVQSSASVAQSVLTEPVSEQTMAPTQPLTQQIGVIVNGRTYNLKGKPEYVFVDVFDYIDFDLSRPQGSGIVTTLNKQPAQYMETLKHGDVIEIYWKQ